MAVLVRAVVKLRGNKTRFLKAHYKSTMCAFKLTNLRSFCYEDATHLMVVDINHLKLLSMSGCQLLTSDLLPVVQLKHQY